MTSPSLDHLVIACATLEQGATWLRDRLGVDPQPGGVHGRMGTHNHLLRLGPHGYLELLAPNPEATDLTGPRWFGLDEPAAQARLEQGPFLLTWVARVSDLESAVARFPALGRVRAFERGPFRWELAMPVERPAFDGALPVLIRWKETSHPAELLEDRGCALRSLTLTHPDGEELRGILDELNLSGDAVTQIGPPSIQAIVGSPRGDVEFGSAP
jgi:hypothetical protein